MYCSSLSAGLFKRPFHFISAFKGNLSDEQIAFVIINRSPIQLVRINGIPVPVKYGDFPLDLVFLLPPGKHKITASYLQIVDINLNDRTLSTKYVGEEITGTIDILAGHTYFLKGNVHGDRWSMHAAAVNKDSFTHTELDSQKNEKHWFDRFVKEKEGYASRKAPRYIKKWLDNEGAAIQQELIRLRATQDQKKNSLVKQ